MTKTGMSYELSLEADRDLEAIFDYTVEEYGRDQAIDYVAQFDALFVQLQESPQMGRERREIRAGLRSVIQNRHIVFCRVLKDRVRIVRVLHGSRDLPAFFTPEGWK